MTYSLQEILHFLEALTLLLFAKMLLLLLPFRWCLKLVSHEPVEKMTSCHDELHDVKLALQRAGGRVRFKKPCLMQSMAAKWMLNRRGLPSTLYFGVIADQQTKFIAHAWVMSRNTEIVARSGEFVVLLEL